MKILQFGFIDSLNIGDRLIAEEIQHQYLENHETRAVSYLGTPRENIPSIADSSVEKSKKKNKLKQKLAMMIPYHPDRRTEDLVEQWIADADCIVFSGGNLIFDLNKYSKSYFKLKWIVELAKKHNKKIVALSIGLGPFKTKKQEKEAVRLLNDLSYVSVRDLKSASYFKKEVAVIQDPVFTSEFFAPLAQRQSLKNEQHIAVSIIDYRLAGASQEQYSVYIKQMTAILLQLSIKYQVTIFSTEMRDYQAVEDIYHLLVGAVEMKIIRSKEELYALYEVSTLIIGTRMHSMIFAVAAKIPVVGISWQDKVTEMFRILADPTSCFSIQELEKQQTAILERVEYKMNHVEDERYLLGEIGQSFQEKVSKEKERVNALLAIK
ncbi:MULTISPECIES: polysaccharide pyruvyl transferase family protein [unclassified Enterococcus]|uniref:polysaccharide pyruvyl transferase family protein n=1 Tax=unclassified Enterococcus TaxID=2608891 RepID=UPI001A9B8803|nr:polysaccharide pyruvyl transferase family protein [Enterococcus sp. DIV1271a]